MKPPKFLSDLYKDLRDRRLLPVVVLLAVGVVAVPFALSESSATAPPPAAAPAPAKATAAEPAVLAEQVGIRNYRQRLERFKSKNPFRQHFKLPEATSSALGDVPASGGVAGGSAADASSIPAPSSTSTGSSTSTSTTPAATPVPAPSPSGSGGTSSRIKRVTRYRYLTKRVDLRIGPEGNVQKVENVGQLDLLPSQAAPVVAFLGVSADGKRAAFLVSTDVSAESGDGSCVPDGSSCQFITMKPGDVETLDYTPNGKTYRLHLLSIRDVHVAK